MKQMKRGKWNVLAVLVIGTVTMALTGSQCSRVSDRLTAPSTSESAISISGSVAECVQICNEEARVARNAEQELHRANGNACRLLRGSAKSACLAAEGARHEARMEEISMDMQACKAPCHEQGSGSGGQ